MGERTRNLGFQCQVGACVRPATRRGWCSKHYKRWQAHGDPETILVTEKGATGFARIERFVPDRPVVGCWMFTGHINTYGYGVVGRGGDGANMAHRISFEAAYGPIPAGLVIDHCCRNRACVNPEHLQAVTQKENVRREHLTAEEHMALRQVA